MHTSSPVQLSVFPIICLAAVHIICSVKAKKNYTSEFCLLYF